MKKTYEVPELFVDEYAADTMIASANVESGGKSLNVGDVAGDRCGNSYPTIPDLDIDDPHL